MSDVAANNTNSELSVAYQLVHALGPAALGRRTLVDQTGITEMTIRTHLNRLRDGGWVVMKKSGTELTPKAKRKFSALFEQVPVVKRLRLSKELAIGAFNAAALLRECRDALRRSLYLRDRAVRAGASGAVFLVRDESDWQFIEDGASLREKDPGDAEVLEQEFDPQEGDALIISFGQSVREARAGLWSVIAEMIPVKMI